MIPTVLTVAGSDSGGGAGIQADLKTITALGGYGMCAVTALTAQNSTGVHDVAAIDPAFVAAQIDAIAEDFAIGAAKTGMLHRAEVVEAVAGRLRAHAITPLVVDPVMVAKSGDTLLSSSAQEAMRERILPLATIVTPNMPEAGVLAGHNVETPADMRDAARAIAEMGPEWVLVKGGHLEGEPVDVLYDGRDFLEVARPRVHTMNTHGTGCTYSAAIATGLAGGLAVPRAVEWARDALQVALQNAIDIGHGTGPLGHHAVFACRRQD